MENDSTFVAPEGVYSLTDEHKPNHAQGIVSSAGPHLYPSRISSVIVRYPATLKQGSGTQGLAQLLGGGGNKSDQKKDKAEKATKDRDDGVSLSSSDTPEGSDQPASTSQEQPTGLSSDPHTLFSAQPTPGKKKSIARPKHNLKTTSSTFITRVQNVEGMTKFLQAKTGDITYLFYNTCKSLIWLEAASKAKVYI